MPRLKSSIQFLDSELKIRQNLQFTCDDAVDFQFRFLFEKEMQLESFSNSKSLKSYPSGRNFEGFLILFLK